MVNKRSACMHHAVVVQQLHVPRPQLQVESQRIAARQLSKQVDALLLQCAQPGNLWVALGVLVVAP